MKIAVSQHIQNIYLSDIISGVRDFEFQVIDGIGFLILWLDDGSVKDYDHVVFAENIKN
jgi:hypothetical protein